MEKSQTLTIINHLKQIVAQQQLKINFLQGKIAELEPQFSSNQFLQRLSRQVSKRVQKYEKVLKQNVKQEQSYKEQGQKKEALRRKEQYEVTIEGIKLHRVSCESKEECIKDIAKILSKVFKHMEEVKMCCRKQNYQIQELQKRYQQKEQQVERILCEYERSITKAQTIQKKLLAEIDILRRC